MCNLTGPNLRFAEFNDDWEKCKLKNCCKSILRGASPRPINDSKWFDPHSGVGWIKIADVSNSNKYLYDVDTFLSNKGISKSRYVDADNLILSICASVGKPIINKIPVCIHDGFVVFCEIKENFNIEYLYYFLISIQKKWVRFGQSGSQLNLNSNLINNTILVYPNILEQNKIVQFLSLIDEKIETQNKIINKIDEVLK